MTIELGNLVADSGPGELRQRAGSGGTGLPITLHGADMLGGGDVGGRTNLRAGAAAAGTNGVLALQNAVGADVLQVTAAGGIYVPGYMTGTDIDANVLTSLAEQRIGTAVGMRARDFVLHGTTSEATMDELTTDGAAPGGGNVIIPPVGHVWTLLVSVACICTAGEAANTFAGWLISGCVANIGGTVSMAWPADQTLDVSHAWGDGVNKPSHYAAGVSLANCLAIVDATGAAGHLRVRAQGIAGAPDNTFAWTAVVRTAEA